MHGDYVQNLIIAVFTIYMIYNTKMFLVLYIYIIFFIFTD